MYVYRRTMCLQGDYTVGVRWLTLSVLKFSLLVNDNICGGTSLQARV